MLSRSSYSQNFANVKSSLWWERAIKLYLASADLTRGTVKLTNTTGWTGGERGGGGGKQGGGWGFAIAL